MFLASRESHLPIHVTEISEKQLHEILTYTEGHFLDVKAREIRPGKLTKAISAFANADGGELYIGIADNRPLPFPEFAHSISTTSDWLRTPLTSPVNVRSW